MLIAEASAGTVDSSAAEETGRELTGRLADMGGVRGVQSYWTTPDPALRTDDGLSALMGALQLNGGEHAAQETASRVMEAIAETSSGCGEGDWSDRGGNGGGRAGRE